MASLRIIDYTPPPTIKAFMRDYRPGQLFYDWIVGPVGSGKTTGIFFKLVVMARLQAPGHDGIRRSRAVVVRNTKPMLRDTTLVSWNYWFKHGEAGEWKLTDFTFILKFDDVECEVLFRPLDTADDVARVLSLEVTFALIDEFVQIPKAIIEALSARCGRYPPASEGGATNWGMWGSSNPDTEDNWWYDYLHVDLPDNAIYFKQPSGLADDAENIDNLPGKRAYYTNLIKGKSETWVNQFVRSEWGYSVAGTPVISSFRPELHVSKKPLLFNRHLKLVIGFDPGLAGSAFTFGQEDLHGRLNFLGELVQANMGTDRLISERLRPYLRNRFPGADVLIAPDPAANNRTPNDERTIVSRLRKHWQVWTESNNRLPLRTDAYDYYATKLVDGLPALQIDPEWCPNLIRALKGGWRWEMDVKTENIRRETPEKNPSSHVGDSGGYLARYFHKQNEREARSQHILGAMASRPRPQANPYHYR